MAARLVLLIMLLVPCHVASASAQISTVDRIQIVEKGIYRSVSTTQSNDSGTSRAINTVRDPELITSTTSVLGHVGIRFGLRYVAFGGPGADAELTFKTSFPPGGLRNPSNGQLMFQSMQTAVVPLGAQLYWEYHLENDWEVVPGVWIFEFWHSNKKIGEQRFCVQDFSRPGIQNSCGLTTPGLLR